MKNLPIDCLRTFVTVINLGGHAKAGDALGRSQPAISLQLKRLEEAVGKKLFSRQGQRQVCNAEGDYVYRQAVKMLAINDELVSHFDQSHLTGQIRLGIPSEFATYLLPSIIGDFAKAYPDVSLEVVSALSKKLLQQRADSYFDLILALTDDRDDEFRPHFMQDPLHWVAPPHYKLESPIPLVVAPEGCIYRRRAIEQLEKAGLEWRIVYTNADLSGITAAIKEQLGITVLAQSTIPDDLKIIKNEELLPKLGKVSISLINQSRKYAEATEKLAEFIRLRLG